MRAVSAASAWVLLLVLSPVLLVVGLAVRICLGAPVFFVQVRPGLRGKPFRLIKFRTMLEARGAMGANLPDSDRLTPLGRFLRSCSLDELPELWNVLCGDMNFVGPRPLLMEYLPLYTERQASRHSVRPGITGWAQVNGRNALSWDEKLDLDVWYVENQSLLLDVRILLRTVVQVLGRRGITATGDASMPRFVGSGPLEK